jgi:hypothetical protein
MSARDFLSSDQTFAIHEFRIQDGRPRSSADRIVAEQPEFVIEHIAGSNGTDHDCHALTTITVQPGLRPLNVMFKLYDRPWCGRQFQFIDR